MYSGCDGIHYFKNSKYPQNDRKFDPQIAHKNADWVLGT